MNTCTLDALLDALQQALTRANVSLRQRREARAIPEVQELRMEIPRDSRNGITHVPVSIPLRAFRDPRMPQASMLSIEFDCTFRYRRRRRRQPPELHIVIGRPRMRREALHRLRITCHARDAVTPRVDIDGHTLPITETMQQRTGS